MLYGKYKSVRNAVWKTLIELEINQLPVSVDYITDKLGIKQIRNCDLKNPLLTSNERGLSILAKGNWYIVYNEKEPISVRRFTVAHEIGHILLGHLLINNKKYRTFQKRDEEEQAADMFAARLLAPACVLWGLNLHTPEEIQIVCNISHQSAIIRAERMEILYQRNMFLTSTLEQKVYKQFNDYIQKNKF